MHEPLCRPCVDVVLILTQEQRSHVCDKINARLVKPVKPQLHTDEVVCYDHPHSVPRSIPQSAALVARSSAVQGAGGAMTRARQRPDSRLEMWMLPRRAWPPASLAAAALLSPLGCRTQHGKPLAPSQELAFRGESCLKYNIPSTAMLG